MSPSPQSDCNFFKNAWNERVSWKNKVPVIFYMDKSVPEEYKESIIYAASVWNKAAGKTILRVSNLSIPNSPQTSFDSVNVIYFYNEFWPETSETQGQTKMRAVGDILVDTDIILNGENFKYYTYGNYSPNNVNLETLMIHEFGHALGLSHTSERQDIMYYALALGEERIYVDDGAKKSLKCEY